MQVQFESLLKGIQHHPSCPLCQSSLTPDCQFDAAHLDLNIDGNSLRVYLDPQSTNWSPSFSQNSGSYLYLLTVDCQSCFKFGYVLALTFGLNVPTLLSIHLDSESILWEDADNTLHEVHSRYPTKTSRYSVFPDFNDLTKHRLLTKDRLTYLKEDKITLPFIPINFAQPEETIQRAQTMAVFS